ncbi:major facilitator superfamily domain-containing protein [Lipomyces starkeyi]
MSEHVGRKYILLSFLEGLSATCPIAVSGGVFADIYSDPIKRGRAVALFCGSTIMGSLSGPFIAGYVSTSYLGWRWVFWLTAIFSGVTLVCTSLVLPETFRPILMMRRAQKLRKEGHNVVAAYELEDKDLKMLFKEIIVATICLYVGFTYGLLYMFFQAYPVIFQQERGMSPGKGSLMLLPSTLVLPIGLFWLAWTSYNRIPFAITMIGGVFFGLGFTSLFIGFLNYATDCYKIYAASAHGIMSVTRSIIATCLPLFATAMYDRLGVHWATTLWAFISLAMAPIPILFFKYGHILRQRSAFTSSLATQNV